MTLTKQPPARVDRVDTGKEEQRRHQPATTNIETHPRPVVSARWTLLEAATAGKLGLSVWVSHCRTNNKKKMSKRKKRLRIRQLAGLEVIKVQPGLSTCLCSHRHDFRKKKKKKKKKKRHKIFQDISNNVALLGTSFKTGERKKNTKTKNDIPSTSRNPNCSRKIQRGLWEGVLCVS